MKNISLLALASLFACSGCGQDNPIAAHSTPDDLQHLLQSAAAPVKPSEQHKTSIAEDSVPGQRIYAADDKNCSERAKSRMAMINRSDIYPISDKEHKEGMQALYSACMRGNDWQVASAATSGGDASQLSAMSPAAGGNAPKANTVMAGNATISTTPIPGGTVLVIGNKEPAPTLSSLSPSSGGSSTQGTTLVLLSPQSATPAPVQNIIYTSPTQMEPQSRPVAYYPVSAPPPPPAQEHAPAQSAAPAQPATATTSVEINVSPTARTPAPEDQQPAPATSSTTNISTGQAMTSSVPPASANPSASPAAPNASYQPQATAQTTPAPVNPSASPTTVNAFYQPQVAAQTTPTPASPPASPIAANAFYQPQVTVQTAPGAANLPALSPSATIYAQPHVTVETNPALISSPSASAHTATASAQSQTAVQAVPPRQSSKLPAKRSASLKSSARTQGKKPVAAPASATTSAQAERQLENILEK